MIKVHATNLNIHCDVHPISRYALETLIHVLPEEFSESSLADCDCVFTNAPAAPPYCFDVRYANEITELDKPIFVFNDADGYEPDCEAMSPNTQQNFCNFIRDGRCIKGYFYREWHQGYSRPDLAFPLLTFELVGYLWNHHPKDRESWARPTNREIFLNRRFNITMAQALHTRSRVSLFKALDAIPGVNKRDLYKGGRFPAEDWMNELLTTKMAISLEGAGVKCVSHCEVPCCSILVTHDLPMEETYPWLGGVNCIKLPYFAEGGEGSFLKPEGRGTIRTNDAIKVINDYLADPHRLYDIFVLCQENARKYELGNYWKNHVAATIKKLL
jgi:hypothetical protein